VTDEAAMRLALARARRGSGRTFPNPSVGAVVYRGDRVLGRGVTRPPGGAHAEIVALDSAARKVGAGRLRGASLAVTLEPCSHHGRTGPCADAAIRAGIADVVVGHLDPHPEVRGRGVRRLRRAGVEVRVGVLEAACREQHRGFLSVCERGRPFVTLKLAGTLDGRIATAGGESRWITGPRARAAVHRLRARSDGILVGTATALADDPELSARRGGRVLHRPVRVLLDARLRVPLEAKLYRGDAAQTWVLCAPGSPASRRRTREESGARILEVPRVGSGGGQGGGLDLSRALRALAREGLTELLVEGGGRLAASLLAAGLVDEVHWFVAPTMIGEDGRAALGPLGVERLSRAVTLEDVRVRRHGHDVEVIGRPVGRGAAVKRRARQVVKKR